jgi:hypothetical protein
MIASTNSNCLRLFLHVTGRTEGSSNFGHSSAYRYLFHSVATRNIRLPFLGVPSSPPMKLFECIRQTYDLAAHGKLYLPTKVVPLATVAENWDAPGKPRLVFTLRESS